MGNLGPNGSTATVNPVEGGNSPEQANNTAFLLQPPLVIPAGQTATFRQTIRVTANPQLTKAGEPLMYAAMVGDDAARSNEFLVAFALLEWCAARCRRLLMVLLLLLTLASEVGCDNGSVSAGAGASSAAIHSTQTAIEVDAVKQENNERVVVAGLPVGLGSVVTK
jgi:hypothetical protein